MSIQLQHHWRVPVFAAALMLCAQYGWAASGQKIASLDLHKILGGKQACPIPGSAQFLSENELLLLVGPDSNCYRNVSELEFVVVSTNGIVLARKPEPSTFPIAVLSQSRFAVTELNHVSVFDDHLQKIQTIDLPLPDKPTSFYPRRTGTDLLAIRDARGTVYMYGSNPLLRVRDTSKDASPFFRTFTLLDGRILKLTEKSIVETDATGHDRVVASLSWVNPCAKLCQAYDAGLDFSVTSGGAKRVLVTSNGSRFPVTDAAGLFPYLRLEVFEIKGGTSVFRKQFITRTGQRTSAISPDGDLILFNDGAHIELERLQQ
jgi:hypothetical protein